MIHNVGSADRAIRIILAVVLVAVGLFVPVGSTLRIVLFIIAAIALITGLLSTCGLYALFGISTRKSE